VAVVSDKQN